MKKLISVLNWALSRLCIALMALLLACVLWQVVSRYVLGVPSTATDEMARFLFIWVGLLGAAYTLGQKRHLAIDIVLRSIAGRRKKAAQLLISATNIFFASVIMVYGGGFLMINTLRMGQTSPALGIEMGWVYAAIPLSGLLMLAYLIKDLGDHFRSSSAASA